MFLFLISFVNIILALFHCSGSLEVEIFASIYWKLLGLPFRYEFPGVLASWEKFCQRHFLLYPRCRERQEYLPLPLRQYRCYSASLLGVSRIYYGLYYSVLTVLCLGSFITFHLLRLFALCIEGFWSFNHKFHVFWTYSLIGDIHSTFKLDLSLLLKKWSIWSLFFGNLKIDVQKLSFLIWTYLCVNF